MTIILGAPAAQPPDAPQPDPIDVALAAALTRNLATSSIPKYLSEPAEKWLARLEGTTP